MMTQTSLSDSGGRAFVPDASRFIRTTWMLQVKTPLVLQDAGVTLRYIKQSEARSLEEHTRKRNVFARHSWENNFYLERVREFAEKSVIEVIRPGDPAGVATEAANTAATMEAAALVATVLYAPRRQLQNLLGISAHRRDVIDFIIGPGFKLLSSTSKREPKVRGVSIDRRFGTRFHRLGLEQVVIQATGQSKYSDLIRQSLMWLLESRLDHSESAAVVKTAIALETLLGANETEPLRRTLSERAAFLLTEAADRRAEVSKAVKRFYDARSEVVHGGRKKRPPTSLAALEAAERLTFLCLITVAGNPALFTDVQAVASWVDDQRWGKSSEIARPFRPGDLTRALARSDKPKRKR